jgi:hypothetical protein
MIWWVRFLIDRFYSMDLGPDYFLSGVLTFSRNSLPTLKNGSFLGATSIFLPLLGLRPS